jgi:hypothetical protein
MEVRGVVEYNKRKITTSRPIGTILHEAQVSDDTEALWTAVKDPKNETLFLDTDLAKPTDEMVFPQDEVRLVHNTSNRFDFDVTAARDGYFVLGVPMLKGFEASVDGASTPIAMGNELYPAIFVPRGSHRVAFRFVSKPFMAGVAVAFATAWLWIVVLVRRRLSNWKRRAAVLAVVVFSTVGLVFGLRAWLYQGRSFGTQFTWHAVIKHGPPKPPSEG